MHSSRMRTARCSVCSRGVCLLWGGSPCRGVPPCLGGVGCLLPGGFSLPRRDVCSQGGSPCPETSSVNRITHMCKNITLATTSLQPVTRMHSSRMRTGRSLTVCRGGGVLPAGGVPCPWGLPGGGVSPLPGRVSLPGGFSLSGGCSCPGGSPCRGGVWGGTPCRRPPPPWTQSQTPVKTLPWPNFVAAGNNKHHNLMHSPIDLKENDILGQLTCCFFELPFL